jgi:hypothetical protein
VLGWIGPAAWCARAAEVLPPARTFAIPATDAAAALDLFSRQAGTQLFFVVDRVRGVRTNALEGTYSVREALDRLLRGGPLRAVQDARTGVFVVDREDATAPLPDSVGVAGVPAPTGPAPARPEANAGTAGGLLRSLRALFLPAAAPAAPEPAAVVRLSPFEVVSERDGSFRTNSIGSGSRLSLDLRDAPVAYSVINREFIEALGITDLREAASWSTGNTFYSADNGSDSRGLSSQYLSRGNLTSQGGVDSFGAQRNFYQVSSISTDSYAVETYEFGRGPNAALFGQGTGIGGDAGNGGLSGVSSTQTKRARFDTPATTVRIEAGQWGYWRAALDHNRRLHERLAVRVNVVDSARRGWRLLDMQATRGLALALTWRLPSGAELRLDASNEKRQSHNVGSGWDEFLSGWDGRTVFRGPVTTAMRSATSTPGPVAVANGSYGTLQVLGSPGLTFNGESQGVDRLGTQYWYDPAAGTVMNWQNFAVSRRADSTSRVPLWSASAPNGTAFVRAELPLQGDGQPQPAFGVGRSFFAKTRLPRDLFGRATANSRFRLPSERFESSMRTPTVEQVSRDLQLTWSQRLGDNLFFEVGGDANRNFNTNRNIDDPNPGGRSAYLDLNQLRPDGSPNRGFLDVYTTAPMVQALNWTRDETIRANLAYVADAGKWGRYTFNVQASASQRNSVNRAYSLSLRLNTDPRLWANDLLRTQLYWSDPVRAYTEPINGATVAFTDVAWDATGDNPVIQPVRRVAPAWVLSTWSENYIRTQYGLVQTSARWLDGKLIFTGALRRDLQVGVTKSSVPRGSLPAGWDGTAPLYRPDAPADYFAMTYVERDPATGLPLTGKPVLSGSRPRTNVNGLFVPLAAYAGDRFRDDYNNPSYRGYGNTKSYGVVWHAAGGLSLFTNWSDTYTPLTSATLDLLGGARRAVTAKGFDVGGNLELLGGKVALKYDYFVNTRENDNTNPATSAFINQLYQANAATDPDPTASGRNRFGAVDLPGNDYQNRRNSGHELDLALNLGRALRLTANGSVSSFRTANRAPLTRAYVPANADLFRRILEDAGGRLDPTRRPAGAPHAPGLAVADPAVTALTADQTQAVNAYNNLWVAYEALALQPDIRTSNQPTLNFFADYTVQSGRARGLRIGAGVQWQGRVPIGNQAADTILDPANPIPTAIDDPARDASTYRYGGGAANTLANLSYTFALRDGGSLGLSLRVNNVLNDRRKYFGDAGVFGGVGGLGTMRQPEGNLLLPNREVTEHVVARFTEPLNFRLSATYTFGGGRRVAHPAP